MYYVIGIGVVAALLIWMIGSYLVIKNIERPSYTVLEKRNGYEIRQYKPYLVAETQVTGTYDKAVGDGFRIIADYIFGNNTTKTNIAMTAPVLESSSERIAMTAPVMNTLDSETTRTVSFVLPAKYTLETLPKPNNSTVTIRQEEGRKVAVRSFTWYATERRIANQKNILGELLAADGMTITGIPQVAQYNPPLSFPLTRRNEIIVPIE